MYQCDFLVVSLISVLAVAFALPQQTKSKRPIPVFKETQGLELPNNATSIRENIVDTFSCENRIYGYYADVENECQVFHVCMPHQRSTSRWSFICPAETVFNQETFVCTRTESSIPCEESEQYYSLNENIGKVEEEEEEQPGDETNEGNNEEQPPTVSTRVFRRGKSRKTEETTESFELPTSTISSSRNARISTREKSRV